MKLKENLLVTPIVPVNRLTIGNPYKVVRMCDERTFIVIDDFGIERMCYAEDFKVAIGTSPIPFLIIVAVLMIAMCLLFLFQ